MDTHIFSIVWLLIFFSILLVPIIAVGVMIFLFTQRGADASKKLTGFFKKSLPKVAPHIGQKEDSSLPEIAANLSQKTSVVFGWFGLMRYLVFFIIWCAFFVWLIVKGFPVFWAVVFIGFALLILLLNFISIKRISKVNLNSVINKSIDTTFRDSIVISPEEKLQTYFSGIVRSGFALGSYEVLGKGQNIKPENVIAVTDKHVLFIYVPMPGGDQVLNGDNIGFDQSRIFGKEISSKFEQLLATQSLPEIYHSYPRNYGISFDNIDRISLLMNNFLHFFTFHTKDGKKYTYASLIDDNEPRIKETFSKFIK